MSVTVGSRTHTGPVPARGRTWRAAANRGIIPHILRGTTTSISQMFEKYLVFSFPSFFFLCRACGIQGSKRSCFTPFFSQVLAPMMLFWSGLLFPFLIFFRSYLGWLRLIAKLDRILFSYISIWFPFILAGVDVVGPFICLYVVCLFSLINVMLSRYLSHF